MSEIIFRSKDGYRERDYKIAFKVGDIYENKADKVDVELFCHDNIKNQYTSLSFVLSQEAIKELTKFLDGQILR